MSVPLNCLIVDDEPPAHKVLENYIGKLNSLRLAGNCYNAIEALNFLHEHPVDILFLDINMPELSGLVMLQTLQHPPAVILTTAYSEFALEGYEFGIVDYLLKPIRFDRFLKAVNRVLQRPATAPAPVPKPPVTKAKPAADPFFFVKADGIQHKIWYRDINFLESKGNFVQLHLVNGQRLLTADTLSKMNERLEPHNFMRVHKSYIINIGKVKAIQGNQVLMEAGKIPIGNSYRQVVLSKIGI